jgi:hypothetical protein
MKVAFGMKAHSGWAHCDSQLEEALAAHWHPDGLIVVVGEMSSGNTLSSN